MIDNIKTVTLKNKLGTEIKISNYGGIIQEFNVDGINIVRSKDNIKDYKNGKAYMGALIGRVANRIGEGKFKINNKEFQIPINNGPNTNHGGLEGFDSKVWDIKLYEPDTLVLEYLSKDGEEGFPGNLITTATFKLTDKNELILDLEAKTDQLTPVNLTSHSYFNLNGQGDIKNHLLKVNSEQITSSDKDLLPTGDIEVITNSPLDFREFKPIEKALVETENINIKNAKGLDHNYIFKDHIDNQLNEMAELRGDKLYLKIYSDQPGLQVYTGNYLDEEGANGEYYTNYTGVALEPQNWPDSINHIEFPNSLLKPEEKYKTRIIYEVGKI